MFYAWHSMIWTGARRQGLPLTPVLLQLIFNSKTVIDRGNLSEVTGHNKFTEKTNQNF
jgi:hypothetical protein